MESGAQRAKKVVSDSLGLQLKITTSTKFPWEVGVAVDKYKYKYEKKRGEGTNTVKNSGMQFSHHAMQLWCWKLRQGQDVLEQTAVARPRKWIRRKKSPLGWDKEWILLWMLTFGFAMMMSKKTCGQKMWFLFFYNIKNRHFCSCPNSKGHILQKTLTFLQLLDIPIWRTFYSILTTDSYGNVCFEKAAMI